MRYIWKNGEILPESEANVSVYDSALMFGDMVFEMTRSFNCVQFRLDEHIERLFRSAKYMRIPMPYTQSQIFVACMRVQKENKFEPDDEHRLMINVSRGILPMYSETGKVGTNVVITDFPLRWTVAGMGKLFDDGVHAVIPSQRAIPATLLEPRVKNRNRIHYLMANMEMRDTWAILIDKDGNLTEGPGWNFFAVIDGICVTPKSNVLEGISRQFILENTLHQVRNMNIYDVVAHADEAFITATPFCMLPVVSLNGIEIGLGEMYPKILKMWSDKVGVDIKRQIQSWEGVQAGVSTYAFK